MMLLLTILIYGLFLKLYNRYKNPLLNPLLLSIGSIIALILMKSFSYEHYRANTEMISFFLGPATVILALPMYRQRRLLKESLLPILAGILVSVVCSALSLTLIGLLLGIDQVLYLSLLPKSITTPIGISASELIGGIPALTVVSIILTGILGAIIAPGLLKVLGIQSAIAKGIGIGASTHVVGTSKAIEMGEIEGAMSSLSIALAGVMTYGFLPLMLQLLSIF